MTKDEKAAIRRELTGQKVRRDIEKYCGNVCVNCGTDQNIEYHHIVPVANGGRNVLTNMVALCHECHLKAHGKLKRVSDADFSRAGRKGIEKPENADDLIQKYLTGKIGMKEIKQGLNLKSNWKLTDLWYFNQYIADHHIAKYRNYRDMLLCSRSIVNTFNKDVVTLATVVYEDGKEESYCGVPSEVFKDADVSGYRKPHLKTR